MSFHVSRSVAWNAGTGTPEKYRFNLEVDVDVLGVSGHNATIRVHGTVGVQNNPSNSKNSFKASDFATLGMGAMNLASENQFVSGVEYYQAGLPCIPSGDQSKANRVLIQFRGDTWRSDPTNNNNKSSLYVNNSGVVLNTYDGSVYQSFGVDTTFTLYVPETGDTPVLTWTTSGASSATSTLWLVEETWASWFDLKWEARINYHNNGGSGAPAATTRVVTGESTTLTVDSTRPSWVWHRYEGWNTNSSASTGIYFGGETLTLTRSNPTIDLYAIWTEYYRPGCVLTDNGWKSHQRSGGACSVLEEGTWVEKRTIDGGTRTNDPPQIRRDDYWENMHRIGSET